MNERQTRAHVAARFERLERLRQIRLRRIEAEWSVSLGPELDAAVASARRDVLWLVNRIASLEQLATSLELAARNER